MDAQREVVGFDSRGDSIAATLFLPQGQPPFPALIVCHGAGEFKERHTELCECLAGGGVASLALDMHGHGASGGARFHVDMGEWSADIRAALDFLGRCPLVDAGRLGAFGMSSGGTAALETALVEPRLKVLVVLDPTVRNSLPPAFSAVLRMLNLLGRLKRRWTGRDLHLPLNRVMGRVPLAADPELDRQLHRDPRALEPFRAFPLPGAAQVFFVDTLKRAGGIAAPTLVLWGGEDALDPPETGCLLYEALTCPKQLHVVPGNGHVGHLDRNRHEVFAQTLAWVKDHWPAERGNHAPPTSTPCAPKVPRLVVGAEAKSLGRQEKWALLSPFLRQHGREALSYATLQAGLEYFLDESGYIAFVTARHPVLARQPMRIALCDPLCARTDYERLLRRFLADQPRALFVVISEACAGVLRRLGFKANCIGYEVELPIQTYQTQGNWKELDLIKRARNEARRLGITIKEEQIAALDKEQLAAVTARWMATKKLNDREIWFFARRPVLEPEEDVRRFVGYDREGRVAGFAFYDPIYDRGEVIGYSDVVSRCDEQRFGRLATAIHMVAIEQFKTEGKQVFNLNLAPFVKLDLGRFNDDWFMKFFFQLSARFGNDIYNFDGLAFHKSKYRGVEKPIYCASQSWLPSNDVYLAFRSADISRSYWGLLFQLFTGILKAPFSASSHSARRASSAPPAGKPNA
jgi:alpha-beta hydrolase superfamily lysophospholipase